MDGMLHKMSRFDDDIPEVFRRAMEEAGWQGEQGKGPPANARPRKPWWLSRWFWLLLLALLLFLSFNWIVTTYTDWLWFGEIGYQDVWLKQWGIQVVTFLIFFTIATLVLLPNWHLAHRRASGLDGGGQRLGQRAIRWLISGLGLFTAFVLGQVAAASWETLLRYIYRVPFGRNDPVFAYDLSFYLFELPFYRFLQGWFMPLIVITLLGTTIIYLAVSDRIRNNLPSIQGRRLQLGALPRTHMALILAVFLLLWAASYWFRRFDLLYSPRGVVFGAGYTDLKASLPALWVQMGLMTLVALSVAYLAVRPDLRPALVTAALWLIASVGLGSLYPIVLQGYAVEPNELDREAPYITYNIELTRFGFGLEDIQTQPFDPDDNLTEQDLAENDVALRNIRLWDYRPLLLTYAQLQELRPYYQFNDIDVDRYPIEGESRQVMLSARELNSADLPSRTWVNQKLEYTHGYGIVMNPVDQITPQGRPFFYIQNLPPQSNIEIEIERPEIYYGELSTEAVYVNSQLEEFDFPSGDENVYTSYQGSGGVPIGSWLRRLAFAFRFADTNFILSEYIDPETRVMFQRRIQDRVRQIAPFLWQDHDPYIVAADGRLVWVIDTYTISEDLPYSQPFFPPATANTESALAQINVPPGINYIRNAVKVTVDAYDGTVNFYVADPEDPLIQTYSRAFPGLFHPISEMPPSLFQHVRYPEDLFLIQTRQYLTYHMQDVQVFYNKEDLWQIPNEIFDGDTQPIEPYYVTFPLPGEEQSEFLLIQPYTPNTRNNMIAWIAARSDPPNYGELYAFELPKQELVFGPIQIEGRIDQEPSISQQFSLWNQRGSGVIRGNLLVIPINDSFLYVEPIYLRSTTSALPELQRVILASGDALVMRETLDEALAALVEQGEAVDEIVVEPPVQDGETAEPGTEPEVLPTPGAEATIEELIMSANEHYNAAEAAQRNGDWTTYGRELQALQQDLQRLIELTGGQAPALPTTVPTPVP